MKRTVAVLAFLSTGALAGCGAETSVLPDGPPTAAGVLAFVGMAEAEGGLYDVVYALSAPDTPTYDGALLLTDNTLIAARNGEEFGGAPPEGPRVEVWLENCEGEPLTCRLVAYNELQP